MLHMGQNLHLLAELPFAHSVSTLSPKYGKYIEIFQWQLTHYSILSPYPFIGLWTCFPTRPPVSALWPIHPHNDSAQFGFHSVRWLANCISWVAYNGIKVWPTEMGITVTIYRGAHKSLPRPGRKQATATKLTFVSHSKTIQKVVRPTRYPRQQWLPLRTKNGDLSIVSFFSRVGLRIYQHPCMWLSGKPGSSE